MTPELMDKVADLMEDIENGVHRYGHFHNPPSCADHAEALFAADGPIMEFFGPALRAIGVVATDRAPHAPRNFLRGHLITGPLADLCLKLAEGAS